MPRSRSSPWAAGGRRTRFAGGRAFGFGPTIVLLTAVHFNFAGFALGIGRELRAGGRGAVSVSALRDHRVARRRRRCRGRDRVVTGRRMDRGRSTTRRDDDCAAAGPGRVGGRNRAAHGAISSRRRHHSRWGWCSPRDTGSRSASASRGCRSHRWSTCAGYANAFGSRAWDSSAGESEVVQPTPTRTYTSMKLRWSRPTDTDLARVHATATTGDGLTYQEQGRSLGSDLPAGYFHDHRRVVVGHGPDDFLAAHDALRCSARAPGRAHRRPSRATGT